MRTRPRGDWLVAALLGAACLAGDAAGSDFLVDPVVGNDLSGDGSPSAPWRTIGRALALSATDDVIWLAQGTYSIVTNGEAYPLSFACRSLRAFEQGQAVLMTDGKGALEVGADPACAPTQVDGLRLEGPGDFGIRVVADRGQVIVRANRVAGFDAGIDAVRRLDGPAGAVTSKLQIDSNQLDGNLVGIALGVDATCPMGLADCAAGPASQRVWARNNLVLGSADAAIRAVAACRDCGKPIAVAAELWNNTTLGNHIGVALDQTGSLAALAPRLGNNLLAINGAFAVDTGQSQARVRPGMLLSNAFHEAELALVRSGDEWFWTGGEIELAFGGDNLETIPGFLPADPLNYHLAAGSALVDRGHLDGTPAADIDGDLRSQDGDGDGVARPDIGIDERPAAVQLSGPARRAHQEAGDIRRPSTAAPVVGGTAGVANLPAVGAPAEFRSTDLAPR